MKEYYYYKREAGGGHGPSFSDNNCKSKWRVGGVSNVSPVCECLMYKSPCVIIHMMYTLSDNVH